MPSNAYINFLRIRIDVLKLLETHAHFKALRPYQKNLGFLTRSAIIMFCAAWERYNEDLLLEGIDYICSQTSNINLLDRQIQKTISVKVKGDKNETKAIEIAGNGWKNVWREYAEKATDSLNTPKVGNLEILFRSYLGISNYTNYWTPGAADVINKFVSIRGDIAHNGNKARYVNSRMFREMHDTIMKNVINIDSEIACDLARVTGSTDLPWDKLYFRDIKQY